MGSQKTITVIIDKDGNPSIEVDGFSDAQCLKETQAIEEALGKPSSRKMKNNLKPVKIGDKTKIGG